MMTINENILAIKEQMDLACSRSGRSVSEVTLLAVTKTVPVASIQEAIDAGIQEIGENRIQEAKSKYEELNRKVIWHLIGHLQTNKVKLAVEMFDLIQSVDRLEVAEEIQKRASQNSKIQRILLEVNTSGEVSKFGCRPDQTIQLAEQVAELANLQIEGLMTIGPLTANETQIRNSFSVLRKQFESLKLMQHPRILMKHLSMGMSSDFGIAIEEGSTMIRVGTALFGARNYTN